MNQLNKIVTLGIALLAISCNDEATSLLHLPIILIKRQLQPL